jgi:hypothetical protein
MTLLITRETIGDVVYLMAESLSEHPDLPARTHSAAKINRHRQQGRSVYRARSISEREILSRNRPGEVGAWHVYRRNIG